MSIAIFGCLFINIQVTKAESIVTEGSVSLPANSLENPLSIEQQPQPVKNELTDSVKKLLSHINETLVIDNSQGTEAMPPLKLTVSQTPPKTPIANANFQALQAPTQQALTDPISVNTTANPVKTNTLQGDAKKLLDQAAVNAKINNKHDTPILPSMIKAPTQKNDAEPQPTTTASTSKVTSEKLSENKESLTGNTLEQATKASISKSQITPKNNKLPTRYQLSQDDYTPHADVTDICNKIGKKLSSISVKDCLNLEFLPPRFYSNKGELILEKHYPASPDTETPIKILFIGGIHGDEYSSISVTFKWLKTLDKNHSGAYDWHFLPLANPDGLLNKKASRVNANKVDLNRNFIPAETAVNPLQHWQTYAKKRPRYYPGTKPLSEPESQAIHTLIDELKPDVIVSVHAPHGILDFDGSIQPPRKLGPLYLKQLGTYPGSLGNYGWFVKSIPVMTIELKHAGIMPKKAEISRMWTDLIGWIKLRTNGKDSLLARRADIPE